MSETAVNSKFAQSLNSIGGEIGGWGPRVEQLRVEIIESNPNPTNVLAAGFAECRLALGSDFPVYLSAATEYAQSPGSHDFDPAKLVSSVGAPLSHEKTNGAISREKYGALWFLMLLVLLMILLTGCTPGRVEANGQTDTPDTSKPTVGPETTSAAPTEMVAASPTATQIEPTVAPTNTPVPTATLEPTNTPEPTQVVMPDYLATYCERGYDALNSDTELYVVIDEGKIHYSDLNGVVFNERIIRSWQEVDYVEDGVRKHGIVLGYVRRGGSGPNAEFGKFTLANSGSITANPSVEWVKSIDNSWTGRTEGTHTTFKGTIGINEDPSIQLLFDGFFPIVNGVPQPVTIPGIGTVLPITSMEVVKAEMAQQP